MDPVQKEQDIGMSDPEERQDRPDEDKTPVPPTGPATAIRAADGFSGFRFLLPPYGSARREAKLQTAYLESHRRVSDPRQNAESTPPADERIKIQSIWVAEVYAPSSLNGLRDGIRQLGWNRQSDRGGQDLASWLAAAREAPHAGHWYNLGAIERPPGNRFHIGQTAALPQCVDYALGFLSHVSPSLTVALFQFVLTDDVGVIDTVLREEHATKSKKSGTWTKWLGPFEQKQEAVVAMRQSLRRECAGWFVDNLPGSFSSGLLAGSFPTIEFITTLMGRPFSHSPVPWGYMSAAGLGDTFDQWEAPDLAGITVSFGGSDDPSARYTGIVAGEWETIATNDDLRNYGEGRSKNTLVNFLEFQLAGHVLAWCLHVTAVGYERGLSQVRDAAIGAQRTRRRTIAVVDQVRNLLVTLDTDAHLFGVELQRLSMSTFTTMGVTLRERHPLADGEPRDFIEDLVAGLRERGERLVSFESDVRSSVLVNAELRSVSANLRLQISLLLLTIFAIVLAAVSLVIAARSGH